MTNIPKGFLARYVYHRLDAHTALSGEAVMARLDEYAAEHLTGGTAALTDADRALILHEHQEARSLHYAVVAGHIR